MLKIIFFERQGLIFPSPSSFDWLQVKQNHWKYHWSWLHHNSENFVDRFPVRFQCCSINTFVDSGIVNYVILIIVWTLEVHMCARHIAAEVSREFPSRWYWANWIVKLIKFGMLNSVNETWAFFFSSHWWMNKTRKNAGKKEKIK